MFTGLLFAICACCVWGLVYVIPQYLEDFSATEVVLGRYFTYGLLSALLFFRSGLGRLRLLSPKSWSFALLFALLSNPIYYLGLVAGLRLASPTLSVLITGLAPITIALYGNWRSREIAYRDLVVPCLWITVGLILVNAIEVDWSFKAKSLGHYFLGIAGIITALAAWSWYAVHNSRFLRANPQINPSEWATVIGVATLFWVIVIGTVLALTMKQEVEFTKFFMLSKEMLRFFGAATLLGVVCSWLGCFFWSQASVRLSISLMGPLLVFETLFGLLFVFFFEHKFPSWIELTGVASLLCGILMSIHIFRKKRIVT